MKNMKKEHFVLESKTQTEKRDNFGGEKKFGYKMHAASYCPIIQGFTLNTSFTIECGAVYIYAPTMCSARVTSCLASPCGASPPLQAQAVLVRQCIVCCSFVPPSTPHISITRLARGSVYVLALLSPSCVASLHSR